jgi:hypothetical protein
LHTSIEAEASAVGVGWALGAGGTSKSAEASMQQLKVNLQLTPAQETAVHVMA